MKIEPPFSVANLFRVLTGCIFGFSLLALMQLGSNIDFVSAVPFTDIVRIPRTASYRNPSFKVSDYSRGSISDTLVLEPVLATPGPTVSQTDDMFVDVYVLNFNPFIGSQTLTEFKVWNEPDDLMPEYIADVRESSGDNVIYRIAKQSLIHSYPVKSDGFVYSNDQYLECVDNPDAAPYCRAGIDYGAVLNTRYDSDYVSACEALTTRGVDEIWLWGGPWFGYHEYLIVQPAGVRVSSLPHDFLESAPFEHGLLALHQAIDTPVEVSSLCGGLTRPFTVMGFSYEREVGEMLEDLGHRSESVLQRSLGLALWDRFDGQRQRYSQNYACPSSPDSGHPEVDPNNMHCGNVHFPPNAYCHYQYDRNLSVQSDCRDWLNYPDLTGQKTTVNSNTWGRTKRGFLKWWFGHFPRNPGVQEGIYNNWWKYIFPTSTSGATPVPTVESGRLRITDVVFSPSSLSVGGVLRVEITVRNESGTGAETQGPNPGFTYEEGEDFKSRGYPEETGRWRVGVNFGTSELPYGSYPYRWGLGSSLEPGETRTITGYIRLTIPQTQDYWVGIVQEGIGWYDEGVGRTRIAVLAGVATPYAGYLPLIQRDRVRSLTPTPNPPAMLW